MKRRAFIASLASALFIQRAEAAPTTGIASWYGGHWHGRKTASGERYNKNQYTCAMNRMPFGTRLSVTDVHTGKNVVVIVNDRIGHPGRLVDLSEAAAKHLGILKKGLAVVSIKVKGIILP